MTLGSEAIQDIIQCQDYRSFLLKYKEKRSVSHSFTYTMIARRGGFKAKSFPRDVATGNKKLGAASLYPMIKGLGLSGDLAEYFKTLVQIEHPEICFPVKEPSQLYSKLDNLRSRISKKRKITTNNDPYNVELFPLIYAACGNQKEGASLEEISLRTGLHQRDIQMALDSLIERDLIFQKEESRYICTANHLFFEGVDESRAFQKHFAFLNSKSTELSIKHFKSNNALFFSSSFSVQKDRMPELKIALQKLLLQYIDSSENPNGEKVASLVCSLF